VNRGEVVTDEGSARAAAERVGFPVALKLVSPDIVHKTEAGAVRLAIADAAALAAAMRDMRAAVARHAPAARIAGFDVQAMASGAFELILGIQRDPQWGPMVLIGAGGVLAELLDDVVLASAPIAGEDALALLRRLKCRPVLQGMRGRPPLDIEAVADVIVRLSWLAHDHRDDIAELDINPLILREAGGGCIAVDGRARIEKKET
jgi:acetyl-CoA synthetase (ADP-forming)